jgi:UDP-N-acetylmuramate dehydrogenase
MSQFTTFRVGGEAEALFVVQEAARLKAMVTFLKSEKIPFLVVGKGSNILVKDQGIPGVTIILNGELARVEEGHNDGIAAGGGLPLTALLAYCRQQGLSGLEFLSGIPGTLGGAVAMNAGAWGHEIGALVKEIQVITGPGRWEKWGRPQLSFSYRSLALPKETVIVKVWLQLERSNPDSVSNKTSEYMGRRRQTQPLSEPSAGSVFKNPENDFAGRLIEEAGLKGKQIGGAMISRMHGNFIVNTGRAKAEDILALMTLARDRVKAMTGIELETEIKIIGP